ncbi:MAG TPA: hypothetical protein VFR04_01845 [Solirubrobacterales bacterium]|nr:hypothetical protein [Solirubrobacterales bacterium]
MKRLGKGPELKMPELKVPSFLIDLYHDLVDRRLLPFVALVAVAIAAVPFLLGGGLEEEVPPTPQGPSAGASSLPSDEAARLTVVQANPGLRDYRKRLAAREPTDPFKQHYTGPVRAGSQLQGESTTSTGSAVPGGTTASSTTTTGPSTTVAPDSSSNGGGGPSGDAPSGGGSEPDLQLFTFAIDVSIKRTTSGPDGRKDEGEPTTKEGVVPPAALPGNKTQVVTYMGISPKTRNPLLLVSDDVTAVSGDAKCLSGSESCQLLEVEVGFPMTFVYGPNDARYKINVLKVEPVTAGRS